MGLLGGLFGEDDVPQRQIAQVDPQTKSLMDQNLSEAADPNSLKGKFSDIDQNLSTGTKAFNSYNPIGGGAIKEKYGRVLAQNIDQMRAGFQQNARAVQLDKMQMAQAAYISQQDTQNNAYAAQLQAHQMQEAARAQAIGSIIGAGAIAGGMYAASKKPQVKEEGLGQQYGMGSFNDTPGMRQGMSNSMNYRDSLEA